MIILFGHFYFCLFVGTRFSDVVIVGARSIITASTLV